MKYRWKAPVQLYLDEPDNFSCSSSSSEQSKATPNSQIYCRMCRIHFPSRARKMRHLQSVSHLRSQSLQKQFSLEASCSSYGSSGDDQLIAASHRVKKRKAQQPLEEEAGRKMRKTEEQSQPKQSSNLGNSPTTVAMEPSKALEGDRGNSSRSSKTPLAAAAQVIAIDDSAEEKRLKNYILSMRKELQTRQPNDA